MADIAASQESNANYAWSLHILSCLKPINGVAGFLLANGALGDSDTLEIRKKLIPNDKLEAIIILPRELFITTDTVSVCTDSICQRSQNSSPSSQTIALR